VSYGIVYLVTNRVNGKFYVGQTVQRLERRWGQHVSAANCVKRKRHALALAIAKHGADNFDVTLLCECRDQWQLNVFEALYMQQYDSAAPNGYNLQLGGGRAKMSEVARQHITDAARTRYRNEAHIARTAANLVKHSRSPEGRARSSKMFKGKPKSPLHVSKMRFARFKPVKLRNPEGQIVNGAGIRLFCAAHGLVVGSVIDLMKGRIKQHKGWTLP
jgi:group I intron endonuclease